jgi:formylglycine-generating enzyme required for sulfatase activity
MTSDAPIDEIKNQPVGTALMRNRRLVIIGDPGCGKSTLLSYLTLVYAYILRDGENPVKTSLELDDKDYLPIYLPLRHLGQYLQERNSNPGKDGPALMLDYLNDFFSSQVINLPDTLFINNLDSGKSIVLMDGLDEVADIETRQRVTRVIEKFVNRYPSCRYIVSSRTVGYEGATRIGLGFGLVKIQDFSQNDVRQFVHNWINAVLNTKEGEELERKNIADMQAEQLINSIESNRRVAELAVNPLLLTVIAMVHRYRNRLPEKRSELYEEALFVLLGSWDDAKEGMTAELEIGNLRMDAGDRRSILEPIAFWLHEHHKHEIEMDNLSSLLIPVFTHLIGSSQTSIKLVDEFLKTINERSGLLVEQQKGVYKFSHLTFQEYLTARALADRDDSIEYTLKRIYDPWWHEVILLEAGYLGTQGKKRVSNLINAIVDLKTKSNSEPFHHLLLAAECLYDVGPTRVTGDLLGEVQRRLQETAYLPIQKENRNSVLNAVAATNALARIDQALFTSQYWNTPWGEPQWITIPASTFWMGDNDSEFIYDKPAHQLFLPEFQISRVPITNAQYEIYVIETGVRAPSHWHNKNVPIGMENHPVVDVTWFEVLDYCKWLSEKIQKPICLPSEAQWEKAARGHQDQRNFPWGEWQKLRCNSLALGLGETTPVGLFLDGASPYGVLNMSGNIYEWTRSIWYVEKFTYPYEPNDGREKLEGNQPRVLRGGSFINRHEDVRCSSRFGRNPDRKYHIAGFRIAISRVNP